MHRSTKFGWLFVVVVVGRSLKERSVVIVGSVNHDEISRVERLPAAGETVRCIKRERCAGGKGLNQAIAASRLGGRACLIGQIGNDAAGAFILKAIEHEKLELRLRIVDGASTGAGIVSLANDGSVYSVVFPGANFEAWDDNKNTETFQDDDCGVLVLQREIPDAVNAKYIEMCISKKDIFILLDAGGSLETFSSSPDISKRIDCLAPNLSELKALVPHLQDIEKDEASIIHAARSLGYAHVLVTCGQRGAFFVAKDYVLKQPAFPIDIIADETAAGDAFRAAFAVELNRLGEKSTEAFSQALHFAAAAGALAVTKPGAVPSLPNRDECQKFIMKTKGKFRPKFYDQEEKKQAHHSHSHYQHQQQQKKMTDMQKDQKEKIISQGEFLLASKENVLLGQQWQFASRLNSMKARRDLTSYSNTPTGWINRQAQIPGVTLVDLNYPQHFESNEKTNKYTTLEAIQATLKKNNLKCGAVCMRFPESIFSKGGFTHHSAAIRKQAEDLCIEAGKAAIFLGADHLIVWPQFDGYDYPLQVDHCTQWQNTVTCFQHISEALPELTVSLEYKPTDEKTRFFTVPTAGAAVALANDVQRPNFGLTIDVGHCLAAGENPAQSMALAASKNLLKGVQLNDWSRFGTEDGLVFGSCNYLAALDVIYVLIVSNYQGHLYFDTFPRNEDPIAEATLNIRQVTSLANRLTPAFRAKIQSCQAEHDAIALLNLVLASYT